MCSCNFSFHLNNNRFTICINDDNWLAWTNSCNKSHNCYLHFIKTIHLFFIFIFFVPFIFHFYSYVCVRSLSFVARNKLIKLNDIIMEINWNCWLSIYVHSPFIHPNLFIVFFFHQNNFHILRFLNNSQWKWNFNFFLFVVLSTSFVHWKECKTEIMKLNFFFLLTSEARRFGWTFWTTNTITITLITCMSFKRFFFNRWW